MSNITCGHKIFFCCRIILLTTILSVSKHTGFTFTHCQMKEGKHRVLTPLKGIKYITKYFYSMDTPVLARKQRFVTM